jgi:hypothetical protein
LWRYIKHSPPSKEQKLKYFKKLKMGTSKKNVIMHMKKGQMDIIKEEFKIKKGQMI